MKNVLMACAIAAASVAIVWGQTTARPGAQTEGTAKATLQNAQGMTVGRVDLRDTPTGVLLHVDLDGVPAGVHAFHIHTTGKCDAPAFTTAGGHFNPGGMHHGLLVQGGPHAGDLPNVTVPESGKLTFDVLATNVTVAPGPRTLFDADGSAIVIHGMADDYTTDPAGNAGPRIACGVVTK